MGGKMNSDSPPIVAPCVPRSVWAFAAILIFLDALLANQGVISALVLLWQILIRLPWAFLPRYRAERGLRLVKVLMFVAAALVSLGIIAVNHSIADRRANELVAAVHAFKKVQGRYPKSLEELVPTFLNDVPLANYSLAFNTFKYIGASEAPMLMYVTMPPYGRRIYHFDAGTWSMLD